MCPLKRSKNRDSGSLALNQKLMVHGYVCPENGCALSAEVRRGMVAFSRDGAAVGKVAAVILDGRTQKATQILLSRLPETTGYWLVPVDSIAEVRDDSIHLSLPGDMVEALPLWRSGG